MMAFGGDEMSTQWVRKITFVFLVAILCLLTGVAIAACLLGRLPEAESPQVQIWTDLYAKELMEAIVRFETVTSSWDAFQEGDVASFEEVATGTALRARQTGVSYAPDFGKYWSQTRIQLEQVKVVSYTVQSAYVEAIVHQEGTMHYLETERSEKANFLSLTLYLLMREDDTWKVANFVSCPVPDRDPDCKLPTQLDY
jgi:hypothetical protein